MFDLRKLSLLIALLFCSFLSVSYDADAALLGVPERGDILLPKFKIGFELQEQHHLCEWAADMLEVQKQPIISLYKGDRKLWSLEIDTMDFEFITMPFANSEQDLLLECINTIVEACDILKEIYDKKTSSTSPKVVLWKEWIHGLSFTENGYVKNAEKLRGLLEKTDTEEAKLRMKKIDSALYGVQKAMRDQGYHLEVHEEMNKSLDDDAKPILVNSTWKPRFQPQVTVQCPLGKLISLICTLFGSASGMDRLKIAHALPSYDLTQCPETSPEEGLVFLHALICAQLAPDHSAEAQFIEETKENFEKYRQVDAKLKLHFLSRRPFSTMWREISSPGESFEALHNRLMEKNPLFRDIPEKFSFVNYAEEYYNADGKRAKLDRLAESIKEGTFDQDTLDKIRTLLSKGILSTAMIRSLKADVGFNFEVLFKTYFGNTLNSIDGKARGFAFDVGRGFFIRADHLFDTLSPPWFLDLDDSMGAYQDDSQYNRSYGEALIELRDIRHVGAQALIKMGVDVDDVGEFLTNKEKPLQDHVKPLILLLNTVLGRVQ